jgi:aflatoxin B1 aldehyde reductase
MAIFYLHAPDNKTPIEETLAEIDALHKENKFDEFGLSNYASWQVAEIVYLCKQRGYVLPTVYQGPYNVFCRTIEPELLPCIRRLNMRFLAYNATAGGLLTGKYEKVDEKPSEGRFKNPMYQDRYWKKENFDAVERLKSVCASHNIAPADAAHRWLVRHSQLDAAKGDGVIIGASKLSHLEQNVAACRRADPLPEAVLLEIEAANASIKDQFRYFRT